MKGVAPKIFTLTMTFIVGLVVAFVMIFSDPGDDDTACNPTLNPGQTVAPPPGGPGVKVKPMAEGTYRLSSPFGPRGGGMHKGVDFGSTAGAAIYAAADGVVSAAGSASGFGQWIVIDHNIDGAVWSTVYGHMFPEGVLVKAGDTVSAGQHIADVGYNGEVDPPGPGGAHLHFETWSGGHDSGTAVDPQPWIDAGSEPTSRGAAPPVPGPAAPPVLAAATGELPPLPAALGSEEHWQVDTIRLARAIAANFPEITTIGGWRPVDAYDDHPSGRAADIMIPDYNSGSGKALGDRVAEYVMANKDAFHVEYLIWRQTYRPATGESNTMEDRGSDTQNHFDHVHVTTVGGGHPSESTVYGSAPFLAGAPLQPPVCTDPARGPPGVDNLDPASVPADFVPWLRRAGTLCPQISPSLLAAQIQQEGSFQQHGYNSSGASGYTQFIDATWAAYGFPVDDNGAPTGPAGSGDRNRIGDAVMAQGHYMCDIAAKVDGWIAEGKVQAPNGPKELYLAGYNAGEYAVLNSGGFPTGASDYVNQTRPYADTILANEVRYATTFN